MNASMKWFSTLAIALSLTATAAAQDSTVGGAEVGSGGVEEGGADGDADGEEGSDETGGSDADEGTPLVDAMAPNGYPLQLTARPLVIPRGQLTIIAGPHPIIGGGGFTIDHFGVNTSSPLTISVDPAYEFAVGASYGVIDNLEVGAIAIPLLLSPDFKYLNPSLFGVYRILSGQFELGAALTATIPVQSGTDFGLGLGVPMAYHLSDTMRLNTGVNLSFSFGDPMQTGLSIPVGLTVNVANNVFVGARTGITADLKHFGDTIALPLVLQGGYTLANASNGPTADLMVQFGFPGFLSLGAEDPVSKLQTAYWQLTFGANIHLNP